VYDPSFSTLKSGLAIEILLSSGVEDLEFLGFEVIDLCGLL